MEHLRRHANRSGARERLYDPHELEGLALERGARVLPDLIKRCERLLIGGPRASRALAAANPSPITFLAGHPSASMSLPFITSLPILG